ncbi:MAG: BamA/TamA family outer membrane protein [Bacteroidota bacterium]
MKLALKLLVALLLIPSPLLAQKVYLVGDAGEESAQPVLELLANEAKDATPKDVLLLLGDNIFPGGLPDKEHPDRARMEARLNPQLDLINSFPGRTLMVPGDLDWNGRRKDGWQQILNQQQYIQNYLNQEGILVPEDGCPGPKEVEVNDYLTLILLNTQYFLYPWDKPDEESECDNKSTLEALEELKNAIKRHAGKHIVIAAHHPVYTYGPHHGNFSFKEQLFPPVVGSLVALFRNTIGTTQDNTHPKYRAVMKQILAAMDEAANVVYASGHEHSLQLIEQGNHHFIVSGSGAKTTYVKQGKGSIFAQSEQGFAVLAFQQDGTASVSFQGISSVLFRKELYRKELKIQEPALDTVSFEDSTIVAIASTKYQGKKAKNTWLGSNYRTTWSTPVEVDVFDLGAEHGGLQILKKGGGQQTKSLRMQADDERQYVLRSIEKYPENAIPAALRKTFAQQVVEDQISSSHPYGAFVVPTLAKAAQIYHTNPKPVWIPDDPRFGQYQSIFANTLALYEERPNEAAAGDPHFGGAGDVDGTFTVIENLKEDNDNQVDQHFVVRNRLFDLWIGDWDRHDDQWRWAEFKEGKGRLYRPIPRDRDQVFFVNDGIIPWIAARKWALPKIEGFDEEVDWAPGLSQNARFFDRSFMNGLSWADWEKQIEFLQNQLTDEVIERAIQEWPEQIQQLTAERVRTGLKARREDMPRYARELYLFLSKEVEVVGSDKHELFTVSQLADGSTEVVVNKRKKDGEIEQVLFRRRFYPEETKEVRLYGFDGEDVFSVDQAASPKIKIRIIGGTDKDRIINEQGDQRLYKVKVYDRIKSTKVKGNDAGILRLSKHPEINRYDRKAFKYDILMPLVLLGANPDDGLFIGGGFDFKKHGWRKDPYASRHTFTARHSLATRAFGIKYRSSFTDLFGKWDFNPSLVVEQPFGVSNFFGLGNETEFLEGQFQGEDDDDIDFYRFQQERLEADLDLQRNLGTFGNLTLGAGIRSVKVEDNPDRFINQFQDRQVFNTNNYFKAKIGFEVDTRSDKVLPQNGLLATAQVEHLEAFSNGSQSVTKLNADWAFYLSFRLPAKVVIANRVGTAHNMGDYEFFNANVLGGRENLRGYRQNRFYGDTYFYHNVDIRLKLFSFRSYLFPGQFGILGFHDTGRVWLEGENSDTWYTGKGFGIWLSPINSFVLNLNYGFSDDGAIPSFYFGFFF